METGRLYFIKDHSSANIGQTVRLELKGAITVYGSDEADVSSLVNITDLTPVSEPLTEDFYYPFDTLPRYVAFVGTATRINLVGVDWEDVKPIS